MEDYCCDTMARQTELTRNKDDGRLTIKQRKLNDGAILHQVYALFNK